MQTLRQDDMSVRRWLGAPEAGVQEPSLSVVRGPRRQGRKARYSPWSVDHCSSSDHSDSPSTATITALDHSTVPHEKPEKMWAALRRQARGLVVEGCLSLGHREESYRAFRSSAWLRSRTSEKSR